MELISARENLLVKYIAANRSRFEDVDLSNSIFAKINLSQGQIEDANMTGMVSESHQWMTFGSDTKALISGVNLKNAKIENANTADMTINGVLASDLFTACWAAGTKKS